MLETFESHAGGLVMKDADGIAGIDLEIAPKLRTHHRPANRHEQRKVVGPSFTCSGVRFQHAGDAELHRPAFRFGIASMVASASRGQSG